MKAFVIAGAGFWFACAGMVCAQTEAQFPPPIDDARPLPKGKIGFGLPVPDEPPLYEAPPIPPRQPPATGLPVARPPVPLAPPPGPVVIVPIVRNPPEISPPPPEANSLQIWLRAEYLGWWLPGGSRPVLFTTSPLGTARSDAGILGQPATQILALEDGERNRLASGLRLTLGTWFDASQRAGAEGYFFYVPGRSSHGFIDGTNAIVARPFVSADTGQPAAQLIAFPDLITGTARVDASDSGLKGAGLLLRGNWSRCGWQCSPCGVGWETNVLFGYRFLSFSEDLAIREDLTALDEARAGTRMVVIDRFGTRNRFHGLDLGLQSTYQRGSWQLELLGKVALGQTTRRVVIDGSTDITSFDNAVANRVGGLYALSSNIGSFRSRQLAAAPEARATLSYLITPHLRASAGYTGLWWTGVTRVGDQIDPIINTNLIPPAIGGGAARPSFTFQGSTLWVHGFHVGLEYRR